MSFLRLCVLAKLIERARKGHYQTVWSIYYRSELSDVIHSKVGDTDRASLTVKHQSDIETYLIFVRSKLTPLRLRDETFCGRGKFPQS
jgi:DNA topoisomerase VI subunit A